MNVWSSLGVTEIETTAVWRDMKVMIRDDMHNGKLCDDNLVG